MDLDLLMYCTISLTITNPMQSHKYKYITKLYNNTLYYHLPLPHPLQYLTCTLYPLCLLHCAITITTLHPYLYSTLYSQQPLCTILSIMSSTRKKVYRVLIIHCTILLYSTLLGDTPYRREVVNII